jgi:uncharacterized damage-inducible protein DinB
MLTLLRDLYDHMQWADATVWRTVFATPAAAGDESLRTKLIHIHQVQRAFLAVWRGQKPHFREDFADLAAVADWGREYHTDARAFFGTVDEAALDHPVVLPWAGQLTEFLGREPEAPAMRDTIAQVALHSLYHRGQVNMRLRELGAEPPLVDYIAWIWMGKPAAEWPTP